MERKFEILGVEPSGCSVLRLTVGDYVKRLVVNIPTPLTAPSVIAFANNCLDEFELEVSEPAVPKSVLSLIVPDPDLDPVE